MTTPEQKAKQLVDNYMHLFSVELENSIAKYEAAECAKLLAEEMIVRNDYISAYLPIEFIKRESEFWNDVKKELEKY